jgi:uncharacterized protein (DUF1778 family)
MGMTLRLDDEHNRMLEALAAAEGVSKNEAVIRAIEDRAARLAKDRQLRSLAQEAIARYRPLLDRLAQ